MKQTKWIAVVCAAALTATAVTGCGTNPQTSAAVSQTAAPTAETAAASSALAESTVTEQEPAADATLDLSNTSLFGTVTAVSGSSVTLTLGTAAEDTGMGGPTPPDMPGGSGAPAAAPDAGEPAGEAAGTAPAELPAASETAGMSETAASAGAAPDAAAKTLVFTPGDTTAVLDIHNEEIVFTQDADGTQTQGGLDDLKDGAVVEVVFGSDNVIASVIVRGDVTLAAAGMGGMGIGTVEHGDAKTTMDSDDEVSGASYDSTTSDENALRVENGANVKLNNISVTDTGDTSSQDNSNFYGQNAGILATDGASVTISGGSVTTDCSGGNGVFSYGDATITISDATITTSGDNSGGIEVAGGGTLNAKNLTIETSGRSAAAIRSDRGGGTETVDGGSYTTHGTGSPAVYSTADVSVSNAALTATGSEAVVVEGKNSVALKDCDVSGSMTGTYQTDTENIHNVMIYQSMSGDADTGTASFTMEGGSMTAAHGDLFYVTNTDAVISLHGVAFTMADGNFLTVAGNDASRGWGTVGANGGTVTMTADGETFDGTISVDVISSLALTISGGSAYTGAINPDNEGGDVSVTLSADSTWSLSGDSYVTSFDGSMDQVETNGHTLYVDGAAMN